MKKTILLLFVVLLFSCQKPKLTEKNASVNEIHNAKNSLDYVGTYKGILPCVDCNGTEIVLIINENSTFCIKTKYEGKGDKIFMQKGNFVWDKNGSTIILTDVKNAPNRYFVGENTLTQLNSSGKIIIGSLADEYILSKQRNDTSSIDAVEENSATVDLNNRIAATTTIEKVNPAIGKYTLAETKWKLISIDKRKIFQKNKQAYFIKLNSRDGKFTAFAGCNSIFGKYAMPSSSTLAFMEVGSTRMACANMTSETKFFKALELTNGYILENETLILVGDNKKQLALFQAIK